MFSLNKSDFFAWCESISHTLNIKNDSDSCNDPLLRWGLCLELCSEHIGSSSGLSLVDWALIHILFFFTVLRNQLSSAVNDWDD
jgi:hypothetical protein